MDDKKASLTYKHFAEEISQIKNMSLVTIIEYILDKADSDFWEMPASSSGVNHPKTSNGKGGQIKHIQSAFWIAHTLCESFQLKQIQKDVVLSAVLLHDICKHSYNIDTHAEEGADFIRNCCIKMTENGMLSTKFQWVETLALLVENHMGPYSDNYTSDNMFQAIVHSADMISSRAWCEFNHQKKGIRN
jgi:hypothetical protein